VTSGPEAPSGGLESGSPREESRPPASSRSRDRRPRRYGPALTVGGVVARTFGAWAANLVPFTLIALVVYSPLLLFAAWLFGDPDRFQSNEEVWDVVWPLGGALLGVIAAAAYTYGVVQQFRGRPAGLQKAFATGLSRTPAALATGIAVWFLAILPVVPGFLLMFVAEAMGAGSLFLLGGSFLMWAILTVLWVAVPVSVVERVGPLRAIARSASLTGGSRVRIFAVLLIFGVLSGGLEQVLEKVLSAGTFEEVRTRTWVMLGLEILMTGPIGSIASAVGYHDLRVGKEGADVEDLARVFD